MNVHVHTYIHVGVKISTELIIITKLIEKIPIPLLCFWPQNLTEKAILESKVPRKSGKCGILPCVLEFASFAERVERILMGSDRRADIDKAYKNLTDALFSTIDRLAEEHPKTPRNVVLFGTLMALYTTQVPLMICYPTYNKNTTEFFIPKHVPNFFLPLKLIFPYIFSSIQKNITLFMTS